MSLKPKFTNEEVADMVEAEGLDYAIQHYVGHWEIKDPDLAKAWYNAKIALDEVENILEESKTGEEDE
jgi:hypothetical protein